MATNNRILRKVRDPDVLDLMEKFEWCFNQSKDHLDRMQEILNVYDNKIDTGTWPTEAQISVPWTFNTVENALPSAVEYLFPKNQFFRLNPIEAGADMETVRRVETALLHTILYRVKLQRNALATLKDCFRFGIGYGIVEPERRSVPEPYTKRVMTGGEVVSRARLMQPGRMKTSIRYRYLLPGQVITSQDGGRFNGVNAVSVSFFVDSYSEDQFRDMYAEQRADVEDVVLRGDVKAIIAEARDLGFQARTTIVDTVAKLAGYKIQHDSQQRRELPLRIPVVKAYMAHRHVWIANGTTIIFDQKNTAQTMRVPLVRSSAWPDGLRWYPMFPVEAGYKVSVANNVWMSAIYDLLTHYLRPELIYDKSRFGGRAPERGPRGEIGVQGPADVTSARYLDTPPVPEALFRLGDMMQRAYAQSVGDKQFLAQPEPGLLRSGPFAFESLLQSTAGRERLAAAVLETDWLDDTLAQVLIQMQLNTGPEGDVFTMRDWMPESNEEYIRRMEISQDDLMHAYDIELDLSHKFRRSASSEMQRQNEAQFLLGSGMADAYEVMMDMLGDDARARRLVLPRQRVEQLAEQRRQAEMEAAAAGQERAPARGPGGPGTREQALAGVGAAALAGGE